MIEIDKRWHRRRSTWVRPPVIFNPNGYAVDVIDDDTTAKAFICEHHYAHSYPAAKFRVGLFGPGPELVGIAIFSEPMNNHTITKYTGLEKALGAELGRFVCLPSVAFNGESWFIPRAFRFLLGEKAIRGVVSYADPLERRNAAGELMKRQHWGTIYQATNALYVGRSKPRTLLIAPDGNVFSERTLQKIRHQERGWGAAVNYLVRLGIPSRAVLEDPAAWINRWIATPFFQKVHHPGNLTYVFGLDRQATAQIKEMHNGGLPYPRAEAA